MKKDKCAATGKAIFLNKELADQAILSLKSTASYNNVLFRNNKKTKKKTLQKRSYFCIYCKGYHLTSMDKTKVNDKKNKEKYKEIKEFFNSFDIEKWKSDSIPFELGHFPAKK